MVKSTLHRIFHCNIIGSLSLQILTTVEEQRITVQSLRLREVTVALGSL